MPDCNCVRSCLCFHDLADGNESGNNDVEYVEVDPTGRYGRYKEVLGKGAFKTVYRAFDQEEGIEVAWNQIQVQDVVQTHEDLDRLYSEVNLLKTLKHKNIIKFYHSWVDKKTKNVNFITEIFTSGTLRQYRKRHKHIDIKAVKNWSRQILRGLLYLHSQDPPIIHRDLKCDNILINGNQGEVKIGDLGLATILHHAHAARSVIGTPEFMAPELYEEEYTELADIYSFGMCLLEMVTSEYPYSECSNAAQIFKKVISGKKPEALKKVKDPEVRQLIEKCLAKASERLSARELLMDPFLQCEGTREAVESVPRIGRGTGKIDDVVDLAVIMEEPHGISATVQISYKLKETLPNLPGDVHYGCLSSAGDVKSGLTADYVSNSNSCKPILSYPKEERARSVDFRVKGNRSEDDMVFLRLRIADSEGKVRNIHFPFDVESDTAMCVASEMVAELDLTDQDVTKIAEMIDAAILALIPEWKPGVAIDETCGDGEAFVDYNNDFEEEYSSMLGILDPLTTILSEGLPEENSSNFLRGSTPEAVSSPRMDGTVYGRFEEVFYQCHRSDFPVAVSEQCTVSTDSPEALQTESGWHPKDSPSSTVARTSTVSLPKSEADTPVFKESFSRTDVRITNRNDTATAFNELVECKRKAGCSNYTHKSWEGIVPGNECPIFYTGSLLASIPNKAQGDETSEQETEARKSQQFVFSSPSFLWDLNDECDDESALQELAELALKHEQELKELQHKHKEAFTELRSRWQRRKSSKSSSSSTVNHQFPLSSLECNKNVQDCPFKDTDSVVNCSQNLQIWGAPCNPSRNINKASSASTLLPNRYSFHELQRVFPCDVISVNDSVLSLDDLSSPGQSTPRSTVKAAGWQSRDAFVNISSTGETLFSLPIGDGMDCKSSTLWTQNSVKSEGMNLCIPIKSQTVEQMV